MKNMESKAAGILEKFLNHSVFQSYSKNINSKQGGDLL